MKKRARQTPEENNVEASHQMSPSASSSFLLFRSPSRSKIYLVQRQLDHHLALARVLKVAGLDDLGGRAHVVAAAASPAKAATATAAAAAAAAERRSASSAAAGGEASSAPASSAAREASAASTAIHLESVTFVERREQGGKKASCLADFFDFEKRK
jgi:hypothetical protein